MKSITFVVDESGAKGYSDNTETVPGELGLMAGYFIPQERLSLIRAELDAIRAKHFGAGKIHITDLEPESQGELRDDLFAYFRHRNIVWTYEAIYVEGFHQHSTFVSGLVDEAKAKRRSTIRLSNNKNLDLLHAELFQGAFGKGVAFCIDNIGNECNVQVITDRVDGHLLNLFNEKAERLLNVGAKSEQKVKGFVLEEKRVVEGSIKSEVVSGLDALGDFSGISYSIACEDSSLTLAADVLANSAHYHLKQLQGGSAGASLNASKAISGHPLSHLVYGAWQDSETNYIADAVYMHPNLQPK